MPRISLPWWAKIGAKLVLSRLPVSYSTFAGLGAFRHGEMANVEYALSVFRAHLDRTDHTRLDGMTCLELGPGDSVVSALIAHAYGAEKIYLVDAGDFAGEDLSDYMEQADVLTDHGLISPDLSGVQSRAELLELTHGDYLTGGLASLRTLPDDSVDFVWSQAVLEHVRLAEFDETLEQLRRVMKPLAIASHRIDLKDHLDRSLHNLRFKTDFWEREGWANSGFYTNRIRYTDMTKRFEQAGFVVDVVHVDRFEGLPVARARLAPEFRTLPDEELMISGFNVLLSA